MRRRLLAVLLLLAVCLSACSSGKPAQEEARQETASAPQKTAAAAQETEKSAEPVINEATGKKKLILAGIRLNDYGWDTLAAQFNAQSDGYIVELRDYYAGDYDGVSIDKDAIDRLRADIADAKTRLHTDLIVGKLPDLLVFDKLSPLTYLGKGLLLDLDPYVAQDEDISGEDFLCWNALHEYGGLYILAKQFVVETLMCSQDFYAAHKGWTIADYLAVEQSLRGDQQMIYFMSQEEFLTQMGGQYLKKALDLKNASCDFDNEEFIGILKGALSCGQYEALDYAGTPVGKRMEAGELMCCATWLGKPADVTFDRVQSGKQLAYIGWPTVDGSVGSSAALYGAISALSATACPEGCWEFVKYVLQYGANAIDQGSPVYAPLMYEQTAQRNETTAGKYTTATQEDVEAYIAAAAACPAMGFRDESITDIITRETAPMFAGDITPEDAARNIQSSVSLYMTEQYG